MNNPLLRQTPILLLFFGLTGCEHAALPPVISPAPLDTAVVTSYAATNRIDPAWLRPSPELFTLGPGDRVEIEMMGRFRVQSHHRCGA